MWCRLGNEAVAGPGRGHLAPFAIAEERREGTTASHGDAGVSEDALESVVRDEYEASRPARAGRPLSRKKRASVRHSALRLHTRLAETEPHGTLAGLLQAGTPRSSVNLLSANRRRTDSLQNQARCGTQLRILSAHPEYSVGVPLPARRPSYLQRFPPMEPTGIEPVTSCLQSRRSPS